MPTTRDESLRFQHDRHDQPGVHAMEDPRNPAGSARGIQTLASGSVSDSHAGYDAQLNPIDDEHINTRGSER